MPTSCCTSDAAGPKSYGRYCTDSRSAFVLVWTSPGAVRPQVPPHQSTLAVITAARTSVAQIGALRGFKAMRHEEISMRTLASTIHLSRHSELASQAVICAAFVATLLTAAVAVSDGPPKLSVGRSCEATASGAVSLGRNKEACMSDERAAQIRS
jgi:hypothetical protein